MEFLGKNQVAAPKLKDAKLSTSQLQIAYEQVVEVRVRRRTCSEISILIQASLYINNNNLKY